MRDRICCLRAVLLISAVLVTAPYPASAGEMVPCTAPDNGSGTVDLPANCPYVAPFEPFLIVSGLPPGTTIELDPSLENFTNIVRIPGGPLGGEILQFDADLMLQVSGTGDLAGFTRTLSVSVYVQIHTAPRTPGDPVQQFAQEIHSLDGELFGDPDFCVFRIEAGGLHALHSPGECTLTDLGGGVFDVVSFFDISYRIEFAGCPASQLEDYSGITTETTRLVQGWMSWDPGDDHKMHFPQLPDSTGWDVNATWPMVLADDWLCTESGWVKDVHFWGSWRRGAPGEVESFILSIHADVPAGVDLPYSHPGELLWETVVSSFASRVIEPGLPEGWYDPYEQQFMFQDHDAFYQYDIFLDSALWFWQQEGTIYWLNVTAILADPEASHWGWKSSLNHWNDDAVWGRYAGDICIAPDNGSGTVDLPANCPYTAPEEVMYIIDGLPPGTTIELDPTLTGYYNITRYPGGTLGGEVQVFDAWLYLDVEGTGELAGLERNLAVPVNLEVHTAPRNPGDPVQTFLAAIYFMSGELFGDPDFCVFRVRAGEAFGLPSPGQMTLTRLASGSFTVESFFDVTYQIEFYGCPDSPLADYSGTTTATIRLEQGGALPDFWIDMYEPPDFTLSLDLAFVITGDQEGCCIPPIRGNVDYDPGDNVNIVDLTYLVAYLFGDGAAPPCFEEGDMNADLSVNIVDLTYLTAHLFGGGDPPLPCP